jgi:hypothetical protein
MVVTSITQEEYLGSLFFTIDLLGIVSLVLDIHWVMNGFATTSTIQGRRGYTNKIQGIVRMSRIIRLSTRIIRIVRVVRILKIFKLVQKKIDVNEQSKVGKQLEEQIIKRLLILILLMIFAIVFLSSYFYYNQLTYMEFGLFIFNQFQVTKTRDPMFNLTYNIYINEHAVNLINIANKCPTYLCQHI